MNPKLLELVLQLVDAGIQCDLHKNDVLGYYWDLNLRAKSHMWLFVGPDGRLMVDMRYDEQFVVESVDCLKYYAKRGMHGRDFISFNWLVFLEN